MNNKEYQKQHYLKNRDYYLEKMRQYKKDHYEEIQLRRLNYRKNNKQKIKEYRAAWRLKNKDKIAKRRKEYRLKYLQNPKNKLIVSFRGQIKRALSGHYKSGSWKTMLGCSVEECKTYLESKFKPGMTWENHGEWHIDHIRPISSFNIGELHKAFHFSNLQPLWAIENLIKGASFEP